MKENVFLVIVLSTIALVGCDRFNVPEYVYELPELAIDGWSTGLADEHGLRSENLSFMMDYINDSPNHNIHSILIFKDSVLLFEEYFEGYLYSSNPPGSNGDLITFDRNVDHFLASVSKSVTSVLFGIAVSQGLITNLDEKLIDVFPEYGSILTGEKADITIKHLLTMTAGLAWDENSYPYSDSRNNVAGLFNADDPIEFILSLPIISTPGSDFHYSSGATNVLGAIIQDATGMDLLDFGNEYLFDVLEMEGGKWQRLSEDLMFASGGIFMRPRELAKIAYLFLNNGYWGDKQILSEEWMDASVHAHISTGNETLPYAHDYGFQWWIKNFQVNGNIYESFLAAGWGDQYMIVIPEESLIVVFNGGNFLSGSSVSDFYLMNEYILTALE